MKCGPDRRQRPSQLIHSPLFYIPNISRRMDRALTCRADIVNLVHASAQSVPSCDCQNCHHDSFSLPYPPRPETRKQVLLEKKKRKKEKVTAPRSRRKSVKIAREGCRRGRWHFTCDETTQLITALPRGSTRTTVGNRWRSIMWLRGNSCRVSAPHHPRADDTERWSPFRLDPSCHFLPCVERVCNPTWFGLTITAPLKLYFSFPPLVSWNGNVI